VTNRPRLRIPTYDRTKDGDVFRWIVEAAADLRKIRQREMYLEMQKIKAQQENKD
jgi:hypothetical protein